MDAKLEQTVQEIVKFLEDTKVYKYLPEMNSLKYGYVKTEKKSFISLDFKFTSCLGEAREEVRLYNFLEQMIYFNWYVKSFDVHTEVDWGFRQVCFDIEFIEGKK